MMNPFLRRLFSAVCLHLIVVMVRSDASGPGTPRSLNASVTGSSEHSTEFALSHAVDGSTGTDGDSCSCCAATKKEWNPWMKVDLGRQYRLGSVEVFARTEKEQDLAGMNMFIHIQPDNWEVNYQEKVTIPDIDDARYYKFPIDYPAIGRYVTLQLTGVLKLVVCEINIYSQDCAAGSYGPLCADTCGHCQEGEICDHVNGSCRRCAAGYLGDHCNKECPDGTFGQWCSDRCHCFNNQSCDHVNGSCPGDRCDLGWHGSDCSNECDEAHYGENCKDACGHCYDNEVCDRRTGVCPSCSSGFTGELCKTECQHGSFGINCSSTCGICRDTCDVITGTCPAGCILGYKGSHCTDVCDHGFYGDQCLSECGHCANNLTCNRTNGRCQDGCNEGYEDDRCDVESQALESNPTTSSSPSPTVIGAVVGTIVVLGCVAVILVIIWRRRRDTIYEDPKWNAQETQNRVYAELDGNFIQQESNSDTLGTETDEYADIDIGQEAPSRRDPDYVNTNQRSK